MANAHLPRHHYAAKWVADKELKTPEEITFGLRLVSLPNGADKEAIRLEVLPDARRGRDADRQARAGEKFVLGSRPNRRLRESFAGSCSLKADVRGLVPA
jgi:hypothetical protein